MEHLRSYIEGDLARFITIESDKRFGKPCIRGTRLAVCDGLSYLAAGMTIDDLLTEWSGYTRDDILAALAFAAKVTGADGEMRIPPNW